MNMTTNVEVNCGHTATACVCMMPEPPPRLFDLVRPGRVFLYSRTLRGLPAQLELEHVRCGYWDVLREANARQVEAAAAMNGWRASVTRSGLKSAAWGFTPAQATERALNRVTEGARELLSNAVEVQRVVTMPIGFLYRTSITAEAWRITPGRGALRAA
jgi:hypothetical protein